ncbi:transporter [Thiopseudomonas alkaliphila]|uniref:C4-dicarboxylic acid transporter DauA n=1 Tax=Thiopseudomonas alkaliphila TaxID=1697053 RepID=UPI00069ED9D3|nr:C4-dicarboxylic acid transporter DauA [Thiopseudomonas alkaliphila]AKX44658.1 transporter [Thiopseudomonas alkaliphila]AKX51611.1 transporter [Thiopseudomonas alkaliphila]AKX55865.1 transporter [Thiopseudomonas alkaliphila]AKX57956.1 transporter [Thiopseudomonas alkaliphila]
MYFPPLFSAWKHTLSAGYNAQRLRSDIIAGITVGIIAIPLAMALSIAIGLPPQHGLYTVLVAGFLIALLGGSRLNVSGPTAAFVVILLPITQQFGLAGLLICTLMAGAILIGMALLRAGSLLQFIPYPVTLGFTAGIGIVLATLQMKDALGLSNIGPSSNFLEQVQQLVLALPSIQLGDSLIAAITLTILIAWPRFFPRVPGHLPALVIGTLLAITFKHFDWPVATLGERFSYFVEGVEYPGIPPFLPSFAWPWTLPGPSGEPLVLSFELFRQLLAPAFAIAMLGAIESLLCAVVADGMAGTKHDSNGELFAQGIGNLVAPLFGGITATAAIARSAANVRAGAYSPMAAMTHALVVLLAMLFLAPLFSLLPMSALAALLLMVAWNMSEPKHVIHTLKIAPRNDILVLLTCLILTVLFDMVLAVGVGLILAAGLFIKHISETTDTRPSHAPHIKALQDLPDSICSYSIRGPLFFGAAEKALSVLRQVQPSIKVVIIDMSAVPVLDMTAIAGLTKVLEDYRQRDIGVILVGTTSRLRLKMRRANIRLSPKQLSYVRDFEQARARAESWLTA